MVAAVDALPERVAWPGCKQPQWSSTVMAGRSTPGKFALFVRAENLVLFQSPARTLCLGPLTCQAEVDVIFAKTRTIKVHSLTHKTLFRIGENY